MNAKTRHAGLVTIVDLSGQIVLGEECFSLGKLVRDLLAQGHNKILLNLAEVHRIDSAGLAHIFSGFGSEEEFNRTMALNPNQVWAHDWHARGLVTSGRTEEAIAQAKLSASLDPSPWSGDYPAWILFLARRYDLALEYAHKLLEMAPNYTWGHFMLALVYEQMGKADEGARESLKADELFGTDQKTIAQLRNALEKSGARGYWEKKLDYYLESAKAGYAPPVLTAEACMRVGDKQCTFEWLEKGFLERDDLMINLAVNPVFDGIRTDPHYQDLVL